MKILKDYLVVNQYSRPQKKLKEVRAIVMHWTANPKANAIQNRNYFNNLCNQKANNAIYASAHYVIGQAGEIVQCLPENEVAYHCGSNKLDPASGNYYTDKARKMLGVYALNWKTNSPNNCTIGIELCPTNDKGEFTQATLDAAIELCACLCKRHGLTASNILTHNEVVGFKDCPRFWVNNPTLFKEFKQNVNNYITGGTI